MYSQQIRKLCFRSAGLAGSLIGLGCVTYFVPSLIPFKFFQFWELKGSLMEAVVSAWPLYAFMALINMRSLFRRDNYDIEPSEIFIGGLGISMWAGFIEEIFFRWVMFFGAIILIPAIDVGVWALTGGHWVRWFYADIVCPIANFFTLGYLQPILLDGYGWVVGAAVITANGQFRNGHSYQGLFGFTLSWFFGMWMFWVMFHYGIPACIAIHAIVDAVVFTVITVDAALEKMSR